MSTQPAEMPITTYRSSSQRLDRRSAARPGRATLVPALRTGADVTDRQHEPGRRLGKVALHGAPLPAPTTNDVMQVGWPDQTPAARGGLEVRS